MHLGPATTVALALAAGMIAQALARHLRLPGIVLLIGAGLVLGPDLAGLVRPDDLGPALQVLVGFAVAIILFEGGMNLNLKRLRRQAKVIRRLLTVGVVVTAVLGAIISQLLMGWSWEFSALFGTLVVVTGPTVITPLLRRIKLQRKLATVLEAEGVLIDAVGAFVAVVTLEVAMVSLEARHAAQETIRFPFDPAIFEPSVLLLLVKQLGFGLAVGLAGGLLIAALLRLDRVVPSGLENVFTLSLVLALFQLSNARVEESGILSVIVAGIVIGNARTRVQRDLQEFKEQLTVMMIGMLFVLLAASVRVDHVLDVGWPGVITVLLLMFVVRPLNILASTWRLDFNAREKMLLSWLAPRGIVAAAVASLIAQQMTRQGVEGGDRFQALVFMVIAMTVVLQGLTGGIVARLLGLRRAPASGYAILGANELGHALGKLLRDSGEEVVFLDSNPAACHVVEQDGFRVVYGNVLEERVLQRARLEDRANCIAVTPNEEANLLFVKRAVDEFKIPRNFVALARGSSGVNADLVHEAGGVVLFGLARDLELWALRLRRRIAPFEMWRCEDPEMSPDEPRTPANPLDMPENLLLPLVVWRGSGVFPVNDRQGLREGDVVHLALLAERRQEAHEWLRLHGWTPVYDEPGEAAGEEPAPSGDADPSAEPDPDAAVSRRP